MVLRRRSALPFAPALQEGADLIELRDSFGVTLDVPSIVRLLARSFTFERLPEVSEVVEPWTSERDLHIEAASSHLPTPSDWIDALVREGVAADWRLYGDRPAPVSRVPKEDYSGWFLQRLERTSESNGGVKLLLPCRGVDCPPLSRARLTAPEAAPARLVAAYRLRCKTSRMGLPPAVAGRFP
jgi:hypothetical protein